MISEIIPTSEERWRLNIDFRNDVKRLAALDPLVPFKFVSMKGGNAQIAVIPQRLEERVKIDPLLPLRSAL